MVGYNYVSVLPQEERDDGFNTKLNPTVLVSSLTAVHIRMTFMIHGGNTMEITV
jgi:hypothetical protein